MLSPPRKKTKTDMSEAGLDSKDLDRFSRQNAALGAETTAKLIKMKAVVLGLRGVGVETCKNLMLQGIGSLTIIDPTPTEMADVGVNFFLTEADAEARIPRADAMLARLKELNPVCSVSTAPVLTDDIILSHRAVVVTDKSVTLPELIRIDALCRANNISFLYNFCGGVSTSIFVDHGKNHIINDPDGEKPTTKLITDISPIDGTDEVMIRYDTPEGQQSTAIDEGHFELSDITGLGLDGSSEVVQVHHPYSDPARTVRAKLNISGRPPYVGGGLMTLKKIPRASPMQSLAEKARQPGNPFMGDMVLTNLIDMGAELQQHVALIAALGFLDQKGRLPLCRDSADSDTVLSIAKESLASDVLDMPDFEVSEDFIRSFALFSAVELQPMAAFTGGVLAQEVVKCTGKFTPIPGWFHFSCKDALPVSRSVENEDMEVESEAAGPAPTVDYAKRGSRYDELASVYGWEFVEKLGGLNYFMVGCGALGCEFLKNFALNGVCCGETGSLTVTDADRIELSNLSRQFLFREHNVGQPKSRAAGVMAQQINPGLSINSLEMFVGPKTEDSFDDDFWMALDGVCNALDNMEARLYVDRQCVKYEKSLLESGTMGTSGNTDSISPFQTRTYADGGAAVEGGGVPMCTLRNFPHLTDHCIEWARDQFELFFVKLPKSVLRYIDDPSSFEAEKRTLANAEPGQALFEARCVQSLLAAARTPTVGTAAQVAFDLFHFLFRDKILDLQAAFPKDYRIIDKETGVDKGPFWSEKKRYPTAACFDSADDNHIDFMISATCLFGVSLGIFPQKDQNDKHWLSQCRSREWIVPVIKDLTVPEYIGAPVNTDGDDMVGAGVTEPSEDRTVVLERILENLRAIKSDMSNADTLPPMETAEFEKDDDLNFHIAFITAGTNLRCDNYTIKRSGFQQVKIVAGKIIAAIATTTAAVCGLVMLELFKIAMKVDTESLMSRMIGLAVNTYTTFSQDPPKPFVSYTEVTQPPPDTPLPDDAYDDKGKLKEEYLVKTEFRAYPEKHTVWDKMSISGKLSLRDFSTLLKEEHGLNMRSWSMVVGTKDKRPVTCSVYPPKPVLDYSLLPGLDLTMQQATMNIMRTAAAKPTQAYIAAWREAKAAGILPGGQVEGEAPPITLDTTLREILERMADIGQAYAADGKVDSVALTQLDSRRFWVIPGAEGPSCALAECGTDVENLISIKIELTSNTIPVGSTGISGVLKDATL